MTVVAFSRERFESVIGKLDESMEEKINAFGTPVEEINGEEVLIDVLVNRPDLFSFENFARSFLIFLGKRKPSDFKVRASKDEVIVDKNLREIRPHTACAVVKGLKLDDERIRDIIDLQEKLHASVGRKRKKLAIGVYPLEKISFPIRFSAEEPEKIVFRPLDFDREVNGREILRRHPTGRDYGGLLEGFEKFPVFRDAKGNVLSMPPIINSADTGKVGVDTKEVFIECSGNNLYFLRKTLNIILTTLVEMGGEVYSLKIKDPVEGRFVSPDLEREAFEFDLEDVRKLLGVDLSFKEIKGALERRDILLEEKKGRVFALVPAYRIDVLHWVDIAEEVAIGIGYDNFEAELPDVSTIGEELKIEQFKNLVRRILVGLGLLEVSNYHLNTKKNIKKMHFDFKEFIEVEDSKTERNVLRIDLLSQILQVFSENSDASYPQEVFEVGRVFESDSSGESETGVIEKENLAVALAGEDVDFTKVKQILDYLFRMIGESYEIEEVENPNFISGRVGEIFFRGKSIGYVGEVAPRVLKNWKIKMPVSAFEISLEELI